jgi:hypothetical protein
MRPNAERLASWRDWLNARLNEGSVTKGSLGDRRVDDLLAHLPREDRVRQLANDLGWDPDEAAVAAGYADVRVDGRNPRAYADWWTWLDATLAARNETPSHLADAIGLTRVALYRRSIPREGTVISIAQYFRVDTGELLALRLRTPGVKSQVREAQGEARWSAKSPDEQQAWADATWTARANIALRAAGINTVERLAALSETELRHTPGIGPRIFAHITAALEIGDADRVSALVAERKRSSPTSDLTKVRRRAAGITAALSVPEAERRAKQERGRAARKKNAAERGSWYTSPEARQRMGEKFRASGGGAKARDTRIARYGGYPYLPHFRAIVDDRRSAEDVLCVFCEKPPLVRRIESKRKRKDDKTGEPRLAGSYHLSCFREWRRSPDMLKFSKMFGSLGRLLQTDGTGKMVAGELLEIRRRVAVSGDKELLIEVDEKLRGELQRLVDPSAPGQPSKLREVHSSLAMAMAHLQYVDGLTAGRVAEMAGLPTEKDTNGTVKPGPWAKKLLRLGRALWGFERMRPGRRLTV